MSVKSLCTNKLMLLLAALAGTLMLPCCISDHDAMPCPAENSGGITFNLTLLTGNMSTRAGNHEDETDKDELETDDGSAAERYIDLDDLNIVILGGDGVVKQIVGPESVQKTGMGISLHVTLERDGAEDIQFMVLANWNNSFQYDTSFAGIINSTTTLSKIFANGSDFNFNYTPVSDTTWSPSITGSAIKGIPMVGLSEVITVPEPSYIFVPEIDIAPIWMLRSLAKIEINNKIPDTDGAEITACRLTKYNTTGRYIPNSTTNPDWNVENKQVTAPSLPVGVTSVTQNLAFIKSADGKQFTAYIPEMNLIGLAENERPVVNVDVEIKGRNYTYTIELSSYQNGRPEKGDKYYKYLLRNHNYRFNVLSVGVTADLTLYIETPEWNTDGTSWTYDDLAAKFSSVFKWTEESEDMTNPYVRYVTQQTYAEASFTLCKAEGCKWTLALYADDVAENDAFRIDYCINDGEWVTGSDSVSGDVDGQEVKIRIYATGPNTSMDEYSARLAMTLTTFDGRIMSVNLTDMGSLPNVDGIYTARPVDPDSDNQYFTIKQKTTGDFN